MPNGKGVCRFHFEGALIPAGSNVLEILEEKTRVKTQEEIMPKKIEIDLEKLRILHSQGLCDREIGERLGCAGSTARKKRVDLGLASVNPRGRRPSGKGSKPATATNPPAARPLNRQPADGPGRITIQVDEVFLDGIWPRLDLVKKAQLINRFCEG
jgi:hypothetical protein